MKKCKGVPSRRGIQLQRSRRRSSVTERASSISPLASPTAFDDQQATAFNGFSNHLLQNNFSFQENSSSIPKPKLEAPGYIQSTYLSSPNHSLNSDDLFPEFQFTFPAGLPPFEEKEHQHSGGEGSLDHNSLTSLSCPSLSLDGYSTYGTPSSYVSTPLPSTPGFIQAPDQTSEVSPSSDIPNVISWNLFLQVEDKPTNFNVQQMNTPLSTNPVARLPSSHRATHSLDQTPFHYGYNWPISFSQHEIPGPVLPTQAWNASASNGTNQPIPYTANDLNFPHPQPDLISPAFAYRSVSEPNIMCPSSSKGPFNPNWHYHNQA